MRLSFLKHFLFFVFASLPLFAEHTPIPYDSPYSEEKIATEFSSHELETVRGRVLDLREIIFPGDRHYVVRVKLSTDFGIIEVRLAPQRFLLKQTTQLTVGDDIEVTGAKMIVNGMPVLVAAEIRKNEQILKLRHKFNGNPYWTGN